MPLKPNSFVPLLVEQIFSRHSTIIESQHKSNTFTKKSCQPLFVELDAIFGDELKLALRVLDEQTITLYTTDKALHEVAEITEGRTAKRVIKLFSNINYCQCENFANNVLGIEGTALPSVTSPEENHSTGIDRYTCHHVLAVRLAKLLQAPCLRVEVLPYHKFNFILKQINPNDSSNGGDILNIIAQHMN